MIINICKEQNTYIFKIYVFQLHFWRLLCHLTYCIFHKIYLIIWKFSCADKF